MDTHTINPLAVEGGWTHPYGTGLFSPFWYADGADDTGDDDGGADTDDDAGVDDDSDDEDDLDTGTDTTTGSGGGGGEDAAALKAEVARLREAYKKKVQQSQTRGRRAREAEEALAKLRADAASTGETIAKAEAEAAIAKARAEGEGAYKPVVVRLAAKAELLAAGAQPGKVARLLKMIDVGEVEVDEDGDVDVSDQVAELKADLPELFAPTVAPAAPRPPKGSARKAGGTGSGDEKVKPKPKNASEQALDRLLGR